MWSDEERYRQEMESEDDSYSTGDSEAGEGEVRGAPRSVGVGAAAKQ